MSSMSFPISFGLFVFGILALNAYSEMASAQATCQPGQQGWTYPLTLTCSGCDLKCNAICLFKPYTKFCNGNPGWFTQGCLCCCGAASPVPVPPSPPPPSPPPPPPPRDPRDLCLPTEISHSSATASCSTCPACNCGPGVTPTLSGVCVNNYCNCCCPSSLTSSATPGSSFFERAARIMFQ
ncbi:hypothetical protein MKX03_035009 [Papaver bracteatum]|nr:hypothetical protein MKX03_035009 [Papaver bracteatum]